MRVLIELEGVLCDVRKARWAAYSAAVQAIGLARTDPDNFWRLLRTGAQADRLIKGAKDHQLDKYAAHFLQACDTDEVVEQYTLQEELPALSKCMAGMPLVAMVTMGAAGAARRNLLRGLPPAWAAAELVQVMRPAVAGAAQLKALAAGQPLLIIASSEVMVRTAAEADLAVVGVAAGDCAAKRLAAAGADPMFTTLDALLEGVEAGDARVQTVGFRAAPQPAPTDARPEDREVARLRDQETRRRERMARRRSSG